MSDWALYLGVAALACAACSLLGAVFSHLWGVDASRETPGTHRHHAGRLLLAMRIQGFAAVLPAGLWIGAHLGQTLGKTGGAIACAGFAVICALLGFLALFTSVRHAGLGLAHVCGEELFEAACRVRQALGCAACAAGAGAVLMSLLREGFVDVSNRHLAVFSCALWPMLSMQMAADRMAPVISSERQMLCAASGGAVCAALIAILMLLPGSSLLMSRRLAAALWVGVKLVWLASWAALVCLSGKSLRALTQRPLARKKRGALVETLLCAAVSIALALAADAWLFVLGAALCACAVIMDAAACAAWLRRIGRGWFLRN